ncbi:MAG: hypothetical protein AVO39_00050 [delta proteobacterium MLS_D]|jgi:UDP-N-acetylmuramoyl-L-alanyl-D-glutamate--2,6-diaminopimelate ligase|nr:MAG: hypothetical protein AVO39_00050 [delta proteobacterium MLS_D]
MELRRILDNLDVIELRGESSVDVMNITCDSRQCSTGSLFFAVPGHLRDGHNYIDEAIRAGTRCVVYESYIPEPAGVTFVRVADSRRAMSQAAKNFFGDPSNELTVVGVTGTNGKTTVTCLVEAVLKAAGLNPGVIGTIEWRYGETAVPSRNTTPESLDLQRILRSMADGGVTHVVMEVSSHAIDMQRVADVHFDLGVFTNLSPEHLDYHGTMENYYTVKKSFFQHLPKGRTAVINENDPWGERLIREIGGSIITFGMDKTCHVSPTDVDLGPAGLKARLKTPGGFLTLESPLTGAFNLSNIMAAVGTCLALKIDNEYIVEGIETAGPVPGRLERIPADENIYVFVDYAHTEDALKNVLETLRRFAEKRLITVFGCGGDRDKTKRPLMGRTAAELSDCVVITSDNPRGEDPRAIMSDIEKGVDLVKIDPALSPGGAGTEQTGYRVIEDRAEAINWAVHSARSGDIVLIAGKGHEDYQIVGDRRLPFDDRIAAARALASRRSRSVS